MSDSIPNNNHIIVFVLNITLLIMANKKFKEII